MDIMKEFGFRGEGFVRVSPTCTVTPDKFEIPTSEIGYALSKVKRFRGDTKGTWSVLHHTMLGFLGSEFSALKKPEETIAWLLHDVVEIAIGDIPFPFKPKAVRDMEDAMLMDLVSDLSSILECTNKVTLNVREAIQKSIGCLNVKRVDTACTEAEAWTICTWSQTDVMSNIGRDSDVYLPGAHFSLKDIAVTISEMSVGTLIEHYTHALEFTLRYMSVADVYTNNSRKS